MSANSPKSEPEGHRGECLASGHQGSGSQKESGQGGPALFVVGTPIGNMDDLSPRAARIIESADIIAAEDTRQTRKLLSRLGIRGKALVSYHDHNEQRQADELVGKIRRESLTVVVVSDAGTPCISDPGFRIVQAARRTGVAVYPVPGPSALTTLISVSGLPSDRFTFVGFLPTRARSLREQITGWSHLGGSVIFFESLRRLPQSFKVLEELFPAAEVCIGRELTKLFEEVVTMPVGEARQWLLGHPVLKGEVTVMVSPGPPAKPSEAGGEGAEELTNLRLQAIEAFRRGATLKDLLRQFRASGMRRSELYQLLLEAKETAGQ